MSFMSNPFYKKKFYIDYKGIPFEVEKQLSNDLQWFGAKPVAFSREVNFVVANKFLLKCSRPATPNSPCPSSQLFPDSSKESLGLPDLVTLDKKYSAVSQSRGLFMLQQAKQKKLGGTTDIYEVCKQYGIKIYNFEKIMSEVKKYKNIYCDEKIFQAMPEAKSGSKSNCDVRKIRAPFIKIEDPRRLFKTRHIIFASWAEVIDPTLSHSVCEVFKHYKNTGNVAFDTLFRPAFNVINVNNMQKVSSNGKFLVPSTANCTKSSTKQSTAAQISATGIRKTQQGVPCVDWKQKNLKQRRKKHCEICNVHYANLDEHVQSELHSKYMNENSNFAEVEEVMATIPKFTDVINFTPQSLQVNDFRSSRNSSCAANAKGRPVDPLQLFSSNSEEFATELYSLDDSYVSASCSTASTGFSFLENRLEKEIKLDASTRNVSNAVQLCSDNTSVKASNKQMAPSNNAKDHTASNAISSKNIISTEFNNEYINVELIEASNDSILPHHYQKTNCNSVDVPNSFINQSWSSLPPIMIDTQTPDPISCEMESERDNQHDVIRDLFPVIDWIRQTPTFDMAVSNDNFQTLVDSNDNVKDSIAEENKRKRDTGEESFVTKKKCFKEEISNCSFDIPLNKSNDTFMDSGLYSQTFSPKCCDGFNSLHGDCEQNDLHNSLNSKDSCDPLDLRTVKKSVLPIRATYLNKLSKHISNSPDHRRIHRSKKKNPRRLTQPKIDICTPNENSPIMPLLTIAHPGVHITNDHKDNFLERCKNACKDINVSDSNPDMFVTTKESDYNCKTCGNTVTLDNAGSQNIHLNDQDELNKICHCIFNQKTKTRAKYINLTNDDNLKPICDSTVNINAKTNMEDLHLNSMKDSLISVQNVSDNINTKMSVKSMNLNPIDDSLIPICDSTFNVNRKTSIDDSLIPICDSTFSINRKTSIEDLHLNTIENSLVSIQNIPEKINTKMSMEGMKVNIIDSSISVCDSTENINTKTNMEDLLLNTTDDSLLLIKDIPENINANTSRKNIKLKQLRKKKSIKAKKIKLMGCKTELFLFRNECVKFFCTSELLFENLFLICGQKSPSYNVGDFSKIFIIKNNKLSPNYVVISLESDYQRKCFKPANRVSKRKVFLMLKRFGKAVTSTFLKKNLKEIFYQCPKNVSRNLRKLVRIIMKQINLQNRNVYIKFAKSGFVSPSRRIEKNPNITTYVFKNSLLSSSPTPDHSLLQHENFNLSTDISNLNSMKCINNQSCNNTEGLLPSTACEHATSINTIVSNACCMSDSNNVNNELSCAVESCYKGDSFPSQSSTSTVALIPSAKNCANETSCCSESSYETGGYVELTDPESEGVYVEVEEDSSSEESNDYFGVYPEVSHLRQEPYSEEF